MSNSVSTDRKSTGRGWPWRPRRFARRDGGLAEEMRQLIDAHWRRLPRRERAAHPLRDYEMTSQFLDDVRSRVGRVPLDRMAWVCCLLICRFDVRVIGLAAGPLRPSSDAPQLTRKNGAQAWWCNLRTQSPADGPRVVYWSGTEGTIELVALGYAKDA
jgi:anti-sigma factor RsiW